MLAKNVFLDFMGSTELIANLFRISQTEEKLKIDKTASAVEANEVHFRIAEKNSLAMVEMGTPLPENLLTLKKIFKLLSVRKYRNFVIPKLN